MQQSKMVELFRVLNPRQWKRFGDFLRSPYFNNREETIRLYDYLQPYHPLFEHTTLEQKSIAAFQMVDEKKLSYLMSQLTSLCKRFLAVEEFEKDNLYLSLFSLQALNHSGALFEKTLRKTEKDLLAHPGRNLSYYKTAFDLSWMNLEIAGRLKSTESAQAMQQALDNLDRFHALQRLRLLFHIAAQKHIFSTDFHTLFPGLEMNLPEDILRKEPLLALYQYALWLTKNDDPLYFDLLLTHLKEHETILTPDDVKNLYVCALNFCTRRININNDAAYYEKYLSISNDLLEKGLLTDEGYLAPGRFMNIVNISIKTERWEYAKDFIARWRSHLPQEYADNLSGYCMALWHYSQGQYDKAQKKLVLVELQDVQLSLAARSLLIKVYFENNETDLLLSALEANRIYLHRATHIEAKKRKQMQQFVDFTRRIVKIYPPDPAKLKALAEKVPPPEQVLHRDWLLAQLRRRIKC